MTFRPPFFLVLAATAFGGCQAGDSSEDPGVAEDLLATNETFAHDVAVFPDRLELPRAGHEDLLALKAGRVLTGAPSGAANPHGFLRRATGVRVTGDRIVVDTQPAGLADVFHGEVRLDSGDADPTAAALSSAAILPDGLGATLGGLFYIPADILLLKAAVIPVDPVKFDQKWDVTVKTRQGSFSYTPQVTTSLQMSHRQVDALRLSARGKLEASVALDVSVKAQSPGVPKADRGLLQPMYLEQRLVTFRPKRFVQTVGGVPVWETVELSLVLRCDLALDGEGEMSFRYHAVTDGEIGAEYTRAGGFRSILDGPTFDAGGSGAEGTTAGKMDVKCSLEPQAALMFYDVVGPTLAIGPYANVHLDNESRTWNLQPGLRADLGVFLEVATYQILSDRYSIVDKPFGSPFSGVLH